MPAVALPPTPAVLLHVTHQHADWIFDRLQPRGRIVALSKGHLSLTDLLAAAIKKSGPARVTVCVWNVGEHDIEALTELRDRGAFLSARFIVPPASEGTADFQIYARFRELFGPEAIVEAACHAKIAIVENDRWSIAIRGSLNMYACGDIESFDVDDSPEVCALVRDYAADPETVAAYPKPVEARERADRLAAAHVRRGCRFFGLTAGYDLPTMVAAFLAVTGPARVSISTAYLGPEAGTWLAPLPGARACFGRAFVKLDHKGKSARAALDAWGAERVRIAMIHAKIVTIRNEAWHLTVRGSANMCRNLHAEQYDVTDDPAVADQADALLDHFFRETPEGLRVPQTIIGRVMRSALGGSEGDVAVSGLLRLPTAAFLGGRAPALRLPDRRVVLATALVTSAATTPAASDSAQHLSTSSPQPTTPRPALTLPRRAAALRLPREPPRALPPPAGKAP